MTAKSRYLASIDREKQHQELNYKDRKDPDLDYDISNALDDPPPPPPNPPTKRSLLKSSSRGGGGGGMALSVTTAKTSVMSSSRNSASSHSDPVRDHEDGMVDEDEGDDIVEPPSSISLGSGGMSINYDEILAASGSKSVKSSESSSHFSLPVLSVSSEERSDMRKSKSSTRNEKNRDKKLSSSSSADGGDGSTERKKKDSKSFRSSEDSYSTLGFSQLDSSTMTPPPPPPGNPPNTKTRPSSTVSARSSKSGSGRSRNSKHRHSRSRSSSASKSEASSSKKTTGYHSGEFSNVDFDLSSLKSELSSSKGTTSHKSSSVDRTTIKSGSVVSRERDWETSKSKTSKTSTNASTSKRAPVSEDIFGEEESVQTEVLRYGEVSKSMDTAEELLSIQEEDYDQSRSSGGNTPHDSVSTKTGDSEKKMSVAEKRRRKAMANSSTTPTSDGSSRASKATLSRGSSKDTEVISNVKSGYKKEGNEIDLYDSAKKQLEKVPQDKADYDDPPLVLYDSDDEDDSDEEGEDKAIRKKKKKKGAISKIKGFLKKNKSSSPSSKERTIEKKSGRNSPFRKRSSSVTRGIKSKSPEVREESQKRPVVLKVKVAEKERIAQESEVSMKRDESRSQPQLKVTPKESIPLGKQDSDLSFDPPRRSLEKLESGLSLASEKQNQLVDLDEGHKSVTSETRSSAKSVSRSSVRSPSRSSVRSETKSKELKAVPHEHKKEVEKINSKEERKPHSGSHYSPEQVKRSLRDPPDMRNIDVNDDHSEDEVSEMTNPTFVSNKLDPPEERSVAKSVKSYRSGRSPEERSVAKSVKSYRSGRSGSQSSGKLRGSKSRGSSDNETPLISNQLGVLHEKKDESSLSEVDTITPSNDHGSVKVFPTDEEIYDPDPNLEDDEGDEKNDHEDEFFDGLNWGNGGQEHNEFFLTGSNSNDHSSGSKDPFEEPFYPDMTSVVSKESESRQSFQNTSVDNHDEEVSQNEHIEKPEYQNNINDNIDDNTDNDFSDNIDDNFHESRKKTETVVEKDFEDLRGRSISPQKINVKKIKKERRKRSESPRKSRADHGNPSSYLKSPGIKVALKNDNDFLQEIKREEASRSPTRSPTRFSKTPSFLAKRQNRDKKEEDIRAKLEKERQNAALENARRRMENVTKASEIGKRRENLILSSESGHSRLSAYGRNRSPQRQRNRTDEKFDSLSLSPSRSRSISPQKMIKINTVSGPGSFSGQKGSMDVPDLSITHRSKTSMRIVESSGDNGPPMRVARSTSNEYDEKSKGSIVRKTFKAPDAFNRNSKRISPFKAPEAFKNPELTPTVSRDISDPIQRAGLRLLSAAAVPIQTEIRRYLAKKTAEDRLWSIIVIQSYFRRWRAELMMYKYLYCATRIQAAFRGWLVRDTLAHKNYCATQIQRVCRGYLATMKVYEALYNITVVQSIARRNAAIKVAEKRYESIVKIQGLFRGHICRRQIQHQHDRATVIQTAWRCFSAQLNYQFDVVDIIIVQSIARKRACQKRYAAMLHKKHTEAAIVIQKYWRGYDCTMTYLHSIADILIVQSIVRRWIAMRYVPQYRKKLHDEMATRIQTAARAWVARTKFKKYKSAVMIQKTWKGFKSYMEYIFTVADIVLVQKTVRKWLAQRYFERLKIKRGEEKIHNAAVIIQKVWRGHQAHMNMLFTLVHIIIAQSVVRRRLAIVKFKPMRMEHRAAVTLQCAWRSTLAKRRFRRELAARKIQAAARGWFVFSSYTAYVAARKIQSWYRCQATRRGYLYYISARTIQTAWRGYDARKLADEERWIREYAATMIQKNWRMSLQRGKYVKYITEKRSATAIQSQWRCFWEYSHFVILRYEVIRIQAAVRGHQVRKQLKVHHKNAIVIQTAARVMLAKRYCHMERLFGAVMYSAQISLKYKNAAKKLQKGFRDMHYSMKEKEAALVIERFFIWVRNEVEKEIERRERVKVLRKQKQRSRRTAQQNNILENVWDETVENVSRAQGVEASKSHDISPIKSRAVESSKSRDISPIKSRAVESSRSRDISPIKSSAIRVSVQQFSERARALSPRNKSAPSPFMNLSPTRTVIKPQGVASPLLAKKSFYDLDNKPSPVKIKADTKSVAIDFDDESSEVSGLTTPSLTPRYLKQNKKKSSSTMLDDELDRALASGRSKMNLQKAQISHPIEEEGENSSKENSLSPPKSRVQENVSPTRSMGLRFNPNSLSRSPAKSRTSMRSEIMMKFSRRGIDSFE